VQIQNRFAVMLSAYLDYVSYHYTKVQPNLLGRHTDESFGFFYGYAPGVLRVSYTFYLNPFFVLCENAKNVAKTNSSSLSAGDAAPNATAIIRTFIFYYPLGVAKEVLWQLLPTSMSGSGANSWDAYEHSNMLLFYQLAG
jgi:hypothetical protein